MPEKRLECVDVGSEFCPCYLADTNDCITCSHLQGKDFCDCNWRGVCVYQEYAMNGYKSKNSREEFISKIEDKKRISDNCTLLKLKVTKTLARQLREPGAYVFLRCKDSNHYFNVPMSIMDTDEVNGYIYIVYQILGSKTKMLDKAENEILIRGPYWNGLLGIKYLKAIKNGHCLIVAKGVAQAPAVLVIKKLLRNNNKVDFIVDKGNINRLFIRERISNLNSDLLNIIEENISSNTGNEIIKGKLENEDIDLVFSGGSDVLHANLLSIIDDLNLSPFMVATNNNEFCCGEGICGSCSTYLKDGRSVKTCKTQLSVREVVEGRIIRD
ncbi:MAG: sulfide/dihydroorotate dehydrogenase-like FAD/NAD-binding protein [Firmicutes bacterium]|nr:sulfide/dihydroorotate dehydrogenase-like FAD/NAD-binding protein [Bacillota bacterium]